MRRFTILLILNLILSYYSFGQKESYYINTKKISPPVKTDSVPTERKFSCRVVDTDAKFGNGPDDWGTYIRNNLKNDVAKQNGCPPGRYTVRINYVVSKEGKVTNIKATTNYGYGMENEAIRIISLSPKWAPATRNGRIVNAYRYQLITFDVCESANDDLITIISKDQFANHCFPQHWA